MNVTYVGEVVSVVESFSGWNPLATKLRVDMNVTVTSLGTGDALEVLSMNSTAATFTAAFIESAIEAGFCDDDFGILASVSVHSVYASSPSVGSTALPSLQPTTIQEMKTSNVPNQTETTQQTSDKVSKVAIIISVCIGASLLVGFLLRLSRRPMADVDENPLSIDTLVHPYSPSMVVAIDMSPTRSPPKETTIRNRRLSSPAIRNNRGSF